MEPASDQWIEVSDRLRPPGELTAWVARDQCGAVVTFCGTVRHDSTGHDDIVALEYESEVRLAEARIVDVIAAARARWPETVAYAVHHRLGRVELGENAVIVAVSAGHRQQAFAAAEFCIDTLKATVPIYKRDVWAGGSAWSRDTQPIADVGAVTTVVHRGPLA